MTMIFFAHLSGALIGLHSPGVSDRLHFEFPLPIGSEGEALADVGLGQGREVFVNLTSAPDREVLQYVADRDSQAMNASLATALAGFNRADL